MSPFIDPVPTPQGALASREGHVSLSEAPPARQALTCLLASQAAQPCALRLERDRPVLMPSCTPTATASVIPLRYVSVQEVAPVDGDPSS